MSGTEQRTVEGDGGGNAGGAGGEGDAEARARALGWRPKEQFTGDPERWLPAEQFLQRGYESPGMMRQNLHRLTDEITAVRNQNLELRQRVDESVQVVTDLTGLVRTADKRAYDKARQELLAEREKAVQTGDTDAFNKVDGNLRELEKTAPVEQTRTAPDPTKPLPPGGAAATQPAGQMPAEVRAFYGRNAWYNSGMHTELAREADAIHVGLLNTRKDLSLEQNLAEVERRIQRFYPELWAAANGRALMPNNGGVDDGGGQGNGGGGGERGGGVSDVSPSGGGGGGTRRSDRNARNFDNMPAESKQAYTRYAKMLEGKGQPLTKDEWATDYWSQFEEAV